MPALLELFEVRDTFVTEGLERPEGSLLFQAPHHLAADEGERLALAVRERARRVVDDTERAEGVPARRDERRAGVEDDVRVAGDERRAGKPRVAPGVGDLEESLALDRLRAERDAARGLADGDAQPRQEPLAVGVDEADGGHRRVAQVGGQARQRVDVGVGGRVEHVEAAQLRHAGRLVVSARARRRCHRRRHAATAPRARAAAARHGSNRAARPICAR